MEDKLLRYGVPCAFNSTSLNPLAKALKVFNTLKDTEREDDGGDRRQQNCEVKTKLFISDETLKSLVFRHLSLRTVTLVTSVLLQFPLAARQRSPS